MAIKLLNIKGNSLFPIGIGTWGIGGFAEKNPNNPDKRQIEALTYSLQKGLNYIEMNMWSAQGYSTYLLAEALKKSGIKRRDIFITFVGYPYNVNSLKELEKLLDKFLKIIGSDYIDSFQSSSSTISKFSEDDTNKLVQKLLNSGKSRFTSFTNGNLNMIQAYKDLFKDKLIAHEVCINFEIRENWDMGIIPYSIGNNILTVVYQPLRRNRTALRDWPLLSSLSKKYNKTQNQIILNWITSKGYLPLIKSENIDHIKENLKALEFKMEIDDIKLLDDFRPPHWVTPKIDWTRKGDGSIDGDGVYIDQLSNIFDDVCKP